MDKNKLIVNVLDVWETDYNDYRALVNLSYVQEKPLGNVIVSYSKDTIYELVELPIYDCNSDEVKQVFKKLVENDLEKYANLPKLSNCSKLLKEIYKNVSESDATMCHITDEDWDIFYKNNFTEKDVDNLKKEVKDLGLEEVITFNDYDCKIIGWGDLETKFLDDIVLEQEKHYNLVMDLMFDKGKVEKIKKQYPKGTEIELISMNDPQAILSGTHGIVDHVDDIGTIFVKWENGSSLGLLVGEDEFKVIPSKETSLNEDEISL